jgi:signal transduction histidine kinase
MNTAIPALEETGLEVLDLTSNAAFAARQLHVRDALMQLEALQRLAQCFVERPETILQELVNAAVNLCGADSAGISIEQSDKGDADYYQWVATAGEYANFLGATLPRSPSACGLCIERGQPQILRVSKPFFDLLGVEALTITDGILLPWQVEETRGTIWIVAHGRIEAFDSNDLRLMQSLATFAAMGVRQRRLQDKLIEQARVSAAAAMANELAHQINNPLQSLTNLLYLASEDRESNSSDVSDNPTRGDAKTLARQASGDLHKLSSLVKKLLTLPFSRAQ